ncbi:hypothetical protein SI65_10324 [Aspergillus cristatus]|uniref:AMP-binding enzyme C-terminal domain-containing protein n=1 Tax=Aspergillus cristatus TaxID=573508 RepID=A0A1E3B025_ASPCR|nr:hypothetical protein SI65_10324 [Aspergillus cristatus]
MSGAQIEGGLILHPDVKEASVVPVTLPGEEEPAPYGFIVKKPGSNLTVDEFVQWTAQELTANMKLYGGVSFINALPLSTSGNSKTDQQALKRMAQEAVDCR